MTKILLLVTLFIILFTCPVRSQLNNSVFYNTRDIEPGQKDDLYLNTDFLFFTKNNEYFNKIADGYTLFGFQFAPYLTYHPYENVRLDMGLYAQKDFGNKDFNEISPYLSIMFKWGPLKQIFGNLDGSLNHKLIEPLYDFERVLNDRQETGSQTLIINEKYFFDLWINWETMLYKGENKQEEVSGGISFEYEIPKGQHKFYFPVQLVLYHRGGQFDSSPDPIATLQNSAVGINYSYQFPETSFIKELRSENYYVYYKDWSPQEYQLPFLDGDGTYLNLSLVTHFDLEFMTSYWSGREFITIKGGQLYPSVSSTFKHPDYIEENRDLLIFRFMHDLHLAKDISWTTRIEPFFDFGNNKWQFSFGFYLNYYPGFFLTELKKEKDSID